MRCKYCDCDLNDINRPAAALDFVSEEGLDYFCSSDCLVLWIMTFANIHFGEEEASSMLRLSR